MNCCDFKMFYVTAMVTTKKIIIKYTQMEMRIKQRHTLQKKLMTPLVQMYQKAEAVYY